MATASAVKAGSVAIGTRPDWGVRLYCRKSQFARGVVYRTTASRSLYDISLTVSNYRDRSGSDYYLGEGGKQ